MESPVESGLHIILQSRSIIRELGLPNDIWAVICKIAFNLTMREIFANKHYNWIVEKLCKYDLAQITIDDSPVTIYTVRKIKHLTNYTYVVNDAFTCNNDLYKICTDLAYVDYINIVMRDDYRYLVLIITEFIKLHPLRVRDILSNFEMTSRDLMWGIYKCGTSMGKLTNILINANCKTELLSCGLNEKIMFHMYLQNIGAVPYDLPSIPALQKYPLFIKYFDLLMDDPAPLAESISLLMRNMT